MTVKTLKFNKPVDFWPKDLQDTWQGVDVLMNADENRIIINKLEDTSPTLEELGPVLKEIGKKISQKDIDDAVLEVRAEKK